MGVVQLRRAGCCIGALRRGSPYPCKFFESLIARVRDLEHHFGYLPDRYLQSLRGQVVSARDHSVMMSGDSIVDSFRLHRLHVCDPVSPTPGSSCDGDSVVPFLRSLFGLPVVSLSSGSVPSAVSPSVSGATFMGGLLLLSPLLSISTLPSYIYSTIPFARQVTSNTHTHTKTRNC